MIINKKLIFILLLISTTVYAQFPITRTIDWDDNPAVDNVTNYNVYVNKTLVGQPTVSQLSYTFPSQAVYDICVSATNIFATSTQTCITIGPPSAPKNIRIL